MRSVIIIHIFILISLIVFAKKLVLHTTQVQNAFGEYINCFSLENIVHSVRFISLRALEFRVCSSSEFVSWSACEVRHVPRSCWDAPFEVQYFWIYARVLEGLFKCPFWHLDKLWKLFLSGNSSNSRFNLHCVIAIARMAIDFKRRYNFYLYTCCICNNIQKYLVTNLL